MENLSVVSGPDEGIDGDDANPTVAELQAALDEFTATQCGGRVYIRKRLTGDATNQGRLVLHDVSPEGRVQRRPQPGRRPVDSFQPHPAGSRESGFLPEAAGSTPTTVTIAEDAAGVAGQPDFELTDIECRDDGYGSATGFVRCQVRTAVEPRTQSRATTPTARSPTSRERALTVDKTPNNQYDQRR